MEVAVINRRAISGFSIGIVSDNTNKEFVSNIVTSSSWHVNTALPWTRRCGQR